MSLVYVHIFPNHKLYIGICSYNDPNKRWKYGRGYDNQLLVKRAIDKYEWDNIQHIVLLENITLQEAEECEKYLICKYNTQDPQKGYNISDGGSTNAGYHHTEEYKQKLSERMKGRYVGEKSPVYGTVLSVERRKQISKTLTGHRQSEATIKKRSIALQGHPVTEETRKKIADKNKGKTRSPETIEKIRQALTGRKQSDETRKKKSEALTGRKRSEETKRKISETQKRRRAQKQCLSSVI